VKPWLLWSVLTILSWGVWAIIGKLIDPAISAAQSQALSTVGLLPILIPLARARPARGGLKMRGAVLALGAGILTCIGNAVYYHLLALGAKAATVVPLTAMYPLVTIVLAVLLLGERLNAWQLGGMALSLGAIYLFNIADSTGMLSSNLAIALLPLVFWGVAGLLQKIATNHISGESAALWFLASFVPVGAILLASEGLPAAVSGRSWVWLLMLGFFFALGNLALLKAFASGGKASIIAPLAALYPAVSIPLAITLLGERVGAREAVGILLALAAVVGLSRETPVPPKQNF
jgi:drug/metabolite transporter (DMT)-like permease